MRSMSERMMMEGPDFSSYRVAAAEATAEIGQAPGGGKSRNWQGSQGHGDQGKRPSLLWV
jgi:hypothetical protein